MKSKIYLGNGSKVMFGDSSFTREKRLSCKEGLLFINDGSLNIFTGDKPIECDTEEFGLDEDENGFFFEIDL